MTIVEDTKPSRRACVRSCRSTRTLNAFQTQRIDSRQIIKRRFFADLFMMLDFFDKGQMTAEKYRTGPGKMTMLGPSIENYEDEFLKPFINRSFSSPTAWGCCLLLPEIEGKETGHLSLSLLSQAQKMSGLTGLEQGMAFVMNLALMFPEVLSKVVDRSGRAVRSRNK